MKDSPAKTCALLVIAFLGFPLLDACAGEAKPPERLLPNEGARLMGLRLKQLADGLDVGKVPWMVNDRRVKFFQEKLAAGTDWKTEMTLEYNLAKELVADGQNTDALLHLDRTEKIAAEHHFTFPPEDVKNFRMLRVQAHMRIGEMENCCAEHNPDSCLLPLQGGAIYNHKDGPLRAIGYLQEQLASDPADLTARWLLNISFMTLGEYPDKVPKQWLVDPKFFQSDYDIKKFPEVALGAGLDTYGLAGGAIAEDLDEDGILDVLRTDQGFAAQMRFFHNNGDGTFADRTEKAGLLGELGGLNMIHADFDNDGHVDVLVLRGGWLGKAGIFPKSLLRNNGDGSFSDVTEKAGLLVAHPTQTAVWFDYDGDGWLDLFVGNESATPDDSHPCELFHNNKDGTFTECAALSGVNVVEFVKGVATDDYNHDGRPDLYISQRGGRPNILFRNDGPRPEGTDGWKFSNVTVEAGLADPIFSFPCWFFDYDNDSWPDIFVCGFAGGVPAILGEFLGQPKSGEHARLYHNNGDGTFTNVAREAGLDQTLFGMGSNFGDLDNDGFLDFYIGTGDPFFTTLIPNRMFRNADGKKFQDVTTSGGFGHLQKGHAVSFADFNNDGQQDIYEVMGGAFTGDKYYSVLYANPGHPNRWLTLKLEGTQSNRSALGARIKVVVNTASGPRSIYRTVSTGGSFGGSPLQQHIGLGNAESIQAVEVFWPVTAKTQRFQGLQMDCFYKLREDSAKPVRSQLRKFKYRTVPTSRSVRKQ